MYFKLLILLEIIKAYAKNIHYEVKGMSFYGKHELADRVIGDNAQHTDDINEVLYLGNQQPAPSRESVLRGAVDNIPPTTNDDQENYFYLYKILITTCNHLNFIMRQNISAAAGDLCGRIASDVQQMAGLVWRQVYPYMNERNLEVEIKTAGEEWNTELF